MRAGDSPETGNYPSIAQIDEDLALLAGDVKSVRTYSVEGTLAEIPRLAKAHDLKVTLGAWISEDKERNEREIWEAMQIFLENKDTVNRMLIGNESLLRNDVSVPELIQYLKKVRYTVVVPVSTAEPWHVWLEHPELAEHVDFIAVHLLPYWEDVPVDHAIDTFIPEQFEKLRKAFPDKPILIAEVGWPSSGRARQGAVASLANQATFLRHFIEMAEEENYDYFIMEAFDQPWKRKIEGKVGTHWGVFNEQREQKFPFKQDVSNVPNWEFLAVIAIGLALLFLAGLLRDSAGLNNKGRGFLALVAYGLAMFIVWMFYRLSLDYMTPSVLVVGVLLVLSALGIMLVVMAEAHEFAEALWLKEWRRVKPPQPLSADAAPKVSIHVPAYNEPPDMMKETLDALARLDYPNFEVLVIDNNTTDPAIWEPVRDHCATLDERFRFYHVENLKGFKAGALNYVLERTDPEAEIVAVIDSDYQVKPDWLSQMVPYFQDEKMAIVQSPQDYRDGHENLFKAMCLAEYHGFFHIGMVTRNERNAIIQHGTMTLVRRKVLEDVGRWSHWSITEDAELGLRIFEAGYDATYIPQSYGKGLMPDTFVDFKKQRYRWAYGAVLILREHMARLLGLSKTSLTIGQRYHFVAGWLPWLADGLNLLFTLAALVWSILMIFWPARFIPPSILFAVLPLTLFFFKLMKMLFLYRLRMAATWRQSLAAGLTGLALSHTISRAILAGVVSRSLGFYRTPKRVRNNRLLQSLNEAREELFFFLALLLSAYAISTLRDDSALLDTRVWMAVLIVQSIPYAAAVMVSIISGLPSLPARMIGELGEVSAKLNGRRSASE
jgi:exo-beta-1,3-glucanase (GH17 family)/cellulose synthase/poly-beta-1,6-N-acetylglucosamine synthase-like glycosyltransferase